jgi:hypothetical protein
MDPAGIRIRRHYRHVVGGRPQMVGLGNGVMRVSAVAGIFHCVQQAWLHCHELYLDHDSQSQHDRVASKRSATACNCGNDRHGFACWHFGVEPIEVTHIVI